MADRSSARMFAEIFNLLASDEPFDRKAMARHFWKQTRDYDFNAYQMYCDEALIKLGLARVDDSEGEADVLYEGEDYYTPHDPAPSDHGRAVDLDCCDGGLERDGCRGPVALRWPGYGHKSYPRCEAHGEARLRREDANRARYAPDGPWSRTYVYVDRDTVRSLLNNL